MDKLIALRRELHENAEIAHLEKKTQSILKRFLKPYGAKIVSLAKDKAFMAVFESKSKGPNIGFRADMDALPIDETISVDYASNNKEVSHKCGHDGHMVLVCSLAKAWSQMDHKVGTLYLLFQHAEETGEGAEEIIYDPVFKNFGLDCLYGFHNIPKVCQNTLIYNDDVFACASEGVKFFLKGKSSHASEPEFTISPIDIILKTINYVKSLENLNKNDDYFISTLVWCKIGDENYGISPGDAQIAFTMRSKYESLIAKNKKKIENYIENLASDQKIKVETETKEPFPATVVAKELVDSLKLAAQTTGLDIQYKKFPFSWSEDFGHYAKKVPLTAYFGLGVNKEHPELHSPYYDFNDDVIESYACFLKEILKNQMKALSQ